MTYASWQPRYRVTTIAPGKLDLLVVTLIDGRRAALCAVTEYDEALAKARAFGAEHQCQIKVLPLTGPEARQFLDWTDDAPLPSPGPGEREGWIAQLMTIARDSPEPGAGADAFDLLKQMGVITT